MTNTTEYMAVAAIADKMGVTPSTVRGWLRNNRLPYFKLGKRVLIHRDDLDAFIQAGKKN